MRVTYEQQQRMDPGTTLWAVDDDGRIFEGTVQRPPAEWVAGRSVTARLADGREVDLRRMDCFTTPEEAMHDARECWECARDQLEAIEAAAMRVVRAAQQAQGAASRGTTGATKV